jgi:hypothetical protein
MKTITKVALAVCGFGLMMSGGKAKSSVMKYAVKTLNMLSPEWGKTFVGNSTELVENVGCMATAAIASANMMKGRVMRVDDGIQIIKNAGGFSGSLLILDTAMKALGCYSSDAERVRNSRNIPELRAKIDNTLERGGLAMIHVDYDLSTPTSNHFIVCYGREAGKYLCMDPAGGALIALDENLHVQRTQTRHYDATGVAPLWPSKPA